MAPPLQGGFWSNDKMRNPPRQPVDPFAREKSRFYNSGYLTPEAQAMIYQIEVTPHNRRNVGGADGYYAPTAAFITLQDGSQVLDQPHIWLDPELKSPYMSKNDDLYQVYRHEMTHLYDNKLGQEGYDLSHRMGKVLPEVRNALPTPTAGAGGYSRGRNVWEYFPNVFPAPWAPPKGQHTGGIHEFYADLGSEPAAIPPELGAYYPQYRTDRLKQSPRVQPARLPFGRPAYLP